MSRARTTESFDYRLRRPVGGVHPGSHRARGLPGQDRFQGLGLLGPGRDARRLDLRATARDLLGRAWVRLCEPRQRCTVTLAVDVSASMGFPGQVPAMNRAARFARVLGEACHRRGDAFALVAADAAIRPDLSQAPRRDRRAGADAARRLEALATQDPVAPPRAPGAAGLMQLPARLPGTRSLVFLLSDGHLAPQLLRAVLRRLRLHEVVLILLADPWEIAPPRRWGWTRLADLETGQERLVLLHPGLAERLAAHRRDQVAALTTVARAQGCLAWVDWEGLDLAGLERALRAGVFA